MKVQQDPMRPVDRGKPLPGYATVGATPVLVAELTSRVTIKLCKRATPAAANKLRLVATSNRALHRLEVCRRENDVAPAAGLDPAYD